MWDSVTSYFHTFLGFLAYHFLLVMVMHTWKKLLFIYIATAFLLLQSICKKLALAPVSTSAMTSVPSPLILVVGSINL